MKGLRTSVLQRLRLGSSLAEQARRQQARLRDIGFLRKIIMWAWAGLLAFLTRPLASFVTLLLIGIAGLFLPTEIPLYWWSPELNFFSLEADAERFITALWQVQGAVLALSIAVIIFAFQAVPTSRYGIKLYEFAEDIRLFPVFNWGIVGLLVDGLVLLDYGRGAPAGTAGSWAVVVSMSSFVTVAWLFWRTVAALDPDRLHHRRLERLREEVSQAVERAIFDRIASHLLQDECGKAGVGFRPFSSTPPSHGARVVDAPRSGWVRDIDLRLLKALSNDGRIGEDETSSMELRAYLGMRVTQGRRILVLPAGTPMGRMRKAQRVVQIEEEGRSGTLAQAAERLHDEALEAIRRGSPTRYEDVLDAYEEALLAFPETWRRYGARYDSEAARGSNVLDLEQTEALIVKLKGELSEAVRSDTREIAAAAARFPARLARRAYSIDAIALSKSALGLSRIVYQSVARASVSEITQMVKDKAWRQLYEFANFTLAAQLKNRENSSEERAKAAEYLRQIFDAYNSLMKVMLEFEDLATLKNSDEAWSAILSFWRPENEEPVEGQANLLVQQLGEDDSQVQEMRRQEQIKQEMVLSNEKIINLRTAYRYGLCFWSLRRLRHAEAPEQWALIFEHFRSHFLGVDDAVRGAGLAFAQVEKDKVPWSDWIAFELLGPVGGGGHIDTEGEILHALITLLLLSTDLEKTQVKVVEPLVWLQGRLEKAERLVEKVSQDEVIKKSLNEGRDFGKRPRIVRDMLRRSAP